MTLDCSQAEENIDLSDNNSNSFGTNLPTRNIESKKHIKFSKTVKKKVSPEIRGCNPEHKNTYETSVFLSREEKYEFSGEKKIRRKKTLQLHSRRTEIASPSPKLSKEKMTRKESTLCQLPNQYRVHKTSLPVCTSSSVIRYLNRCILFLDCCFKIGIFIFQSYLSLLQM
uniref:Uncharacterized protein n=1 Tax=Sciurus vulgaris TaxID=55149 RepID=A0A8D2AY08_SCIVU